MVFYDISYSKGNLDKLYLYNKKRLNRIQTEGKNGK